MKHLNVLAAVFATAGALIAFVGAGTASATVICSTTADPCPAGQAWPSDTVFDFSIPANGSTYVKDTNGNELDRCTDSTIKAKIINTGSATEAVTGEIEELTWGNCTFTTTTVSPGKLQISKIAGTSNGLITSDAMIEWTFQTLGSCVYGFESGDQIGSITEGIGASAVLHLAAVVKRLNSNLVCPKTSNLTGTYVLTSPSNTTMSFSESGS